MKGDCNLLATNLANIGVMATTLDANADDFKHYKSGIYNGTCDPNKRDHNIILVGYQLNQYWIMQNSWANTWGVNGYMQMAWGNTCGICANPTYAAV